MEVVIVGDPHVTADELADCEKLIDHTLEVMVKEGATEVWFLGDLYHTHAIMHVEVLAFWRRTFERIRMAGGRTLCVLGNHDKPGNEGSSAHSLMAHLDAPGVTIVDAPMLRDGVAFVPYMHDREAFVKTCQEVGGRTLVCHQTFDGSCYENGFYAKDGVDADLVPQEFVISGHIHTPQNIGKVWYPGAPRWRSRSDANISRAIWAVTFDAHGTPVLSTPYDMAGVCREVRHVEVTPATIETLDLESAPDADWRIDIKGPAEFVAQAKEALKGPGRRVRTFVTDTQSVRVRESDGIEKAFAKFAASFGAVHGTPVEVLAQAARERLGWT